MPKGFKSYFFKRVNTKKDRALPYNPVSSFFLNKGLPKTSKQLAYLQTPLEFLGQMVHGTDQLGSILDLCQSFL